MGYAISWLAVSGKDRQHVLELLSLNRTGETEDVPESPISSAKLPGGWLLIFANEFGSPLVSETSLQRLSIGCTVVSCQVEEHVMFSSASFHSNGTRTWHVAHDAQESIYNLSSSGELPSQFSDIYAALKKEQDNAGGDAADVDYIHDAPVVLAKSVTSFRHDEEIQSEAPEPFEVLSQSPSSSPAKPWWKVW